uniref:Splicing factor Cactin n=1 Tax=Heterosigma akashiwo TaxID=2829 RepID=A0A6S9JR17_HETAK
MGKSKKKSKDRKRDRSPSSSSSRASDSEEERRRQRKKEKKEKKIAEKKAAKLAAKKAAKLAAKQAAVSAGGVGAGLTHEERKKLVKEEKAKLFYGYTNDENPWGDPNLTKQFVWRRKHAKEEPSGNASKTSLVEKRRKTMEEVEKVRRRRKEREEELEEMERLKAEESRLREVQQFGDWQKKEEDFHRYQAKIRSKIRLIEDRAKPIDLLAKNLLLFSGEEEEEEELDGGRCKYKGGTNLSIDHLEVELREPYLIFQDLTVAELRTLQGDIQTYQELQGKEEGSLPARFWGALAAICADELKHATHRAGTEAKAAALGGGGGAAGRDNIKGGMHEAVRGEVEALFGGRSAVYLTKMAGQLAAKAEAARAGGDGGAGGDPEYWAAVLEHLAVYRAKATLRELHQHMLQVQLDRLEGRRKRLAEERAARRAAGEASEEEGDDAGADSDGSYVVDESAEAVAMERAEKAKGMDDLEEALGLQDEVKLDSVYWWHDKYRPRKPRYFNRVKTGYDWNKYNQAHYDHENPPPKTVQGYKFNIFYPDLIDKSETPKFHLEPAEDDKFCLIRFTAGPPYEDVAFKIVNRAWAYQRKRGFLCKFERGILTLFVNFQRHFYRR